MESESRTTSCRGISPNEWLMRMSRENWLSLDEEIFRERFKDSPLLRPGLEQIKRSVK